MTFIKTPTVWSFNDCVTTITSDYSAEPFVFEGSGADSITFDKGQGRATTQVAADGHVVFSSIAGEQGTVTIESQQTSQLHQYLQSLYNKSRTGASSKRASLMIDSVNNISGDRVVCSYGIFAGEPAAANSKEVQNRSWQILFADVSFIPGTSYDLSDSNISNLLSGGGYPLG